MKLKLGSFLMVAVMFLTSLVAGVSAGETNKNQVNKAEYNTTSAGHLLLSNESIGWCTVVLSNPRSSLNVRNSAGRIVAKLRHGQEVYVDTYDGGWARVSIRRRGRLGILGWVASEYLYC